MRLGKLAAWGGVAGPVLFTAAWVAGSLRQAGPRTEIQLSGLAAQDARDPQIMIAGFVVLGVCSIGFGAALRAVVGRSAAGPWLVIAGGAAAVAAGAFRRDHVLLTGPGFGGESWHNQVHDVVSAVAYAAMLTAPLLLARRFRADPRWAAIARPVQVLALLSAAALIVFATGAAQPAVVQRIAVTLALVAEALMAARMLALHVRLGGAGGKRLELRAGVISVGQAELGVVSQRISPVAACLVQVAAGLVGASQAGVRASLFVPVADPAGHGARGRVLDDRLAGHAGGEQDFTGAVERRGLGRQVADLAGQLQGQLVVFGRLLITAAPEVEEAELGQHLGLPLTVASFPKAGQR